MIQVPITAVSDAPVVLAANGNTPYKTLADVIAAAKTKPDALERVEPRLWHRQPADFGIHRAQYRHQICACSVQRRGAGGTQALVAGDVPLGVLASSSAAPYVPTGQIRVLGVGSIARSPLNPDWPTLKEAGAGDVNASNWTAP